MKKLILVGIILGLYNSSDFKTNLNNCFVSKCWIPITPHSTLYLGYVRPYTQVLQLPHNVNESYEVGIEIKLGGK